MFLRKHFVDGVTTSELEDVIQNLNHVLGTKRGSSYFLRTFGLTDVGYRTPEEMIVQLTAEIKENIELYEPRVELLGVDEVYDEGRRARLVVHLRLRDGSARLRLSVDPAKRALDFEPVGRKDPGGR